MRKPKKPKFRYRKKMLNFYVKHIAKFNENDAKLFSRILLDYLIYSFEVSEIKEKQATKSLDEVMSVFIKIRNDEKIRIIDSFKGYS